MHRFMALFARFFAILGGIVLTGLIFLICLSVLGRTLSSLLHSDLAQSVLPELGGAVLALGIGPINGDFELVEAGMAFAIFAFLPLCHLQAAHASVDIFTARLPRRMNGWLMAVIEVVFAGVMVLIAWQLYLGTLSKLNSGQTTFLIQFPLWWAYAVSLAGSVAAALVAVYIAAVRLVEAATDRVILPVGAGAEQ